MWFHAFKINATLFCFSFEQRVPKWLRLSEKPNINSSSSLLSPISACNTLSSSVSGCGTIYREEIVIRVFCSGEKFSNFLNRRARTLGMRRRQLRKLTDQSLVLRKKRFGVWALISFCVTACAAEKINCCWVYKHPLQPATLNIVSTTPHTHTLHHFLCGRGASDNLSVVWVEYFRLEVSFHCTTTYIPKICLFIT